MVDLQNSTLGSYKVGKGVEKNMFDAMRLYQLSAVQGVVEPMQKIEKNSESYFTLPNTVITSKVISACSSHAHRVAISSGRSAYVTGSWDGAVRTRSKETLELIRAPLTGHNLCVSSVAISDDCKAVISASADGTIRQWNIETGKQIGGHRWAYFGLKCGSKWRWECCCIILGLQRIEVER